MTDPRSGPGLPNDLAPDRGHMKSTRWEFVEVGHVVQDKRDRLHLVEKADSSWVQLKAVLDGSTAAVRRPHYTTAVDIYVPSETECRVLLDAELGARLLRDVEDREHTIKRSLRFRQAPVRRSITALRDHIDWFHGVNVDDVLRRYNGTQANPSNKERKKASLDELVLAHDEMHADPYMWPHKMAHHHSQENP